MSSGTVGDVSPHGLPPGFWWTVVGFVLFGTVGLALLAWMLRRVRVRRAARLARDERGTTIVEFPFALIVLVLTALLTWQLGFMISAYLVVDYAAFAAARAAIVQIPRKMDDGDEEPAHQVKDITFEDSKKGEEISEAAVFVCYPISAAYTHDSSWTAEIPVLQEVMKLPGADAFTDAIDTKSFATRYVYARRNTSVELIVNGKEAGGHAFRAGDLVTVEVEHKFSLRIAIAARVFGSLQSPEGYVTPVTSRASLLYEGAAELVPEGAPSGAEP